MEENNEELKNRVKNWWNDNPFNYFVSIADDWVKFREVDRKVMKWHCPWAHSHYPLLSNLIDYSKVGGKRVLDIAVGTGWSSEQFARMGAEVTAVDITPAAVESTKRRFSLYGLKGEVLEADAEKLPFADNTFDYVLAWGCLMHTPNTPKAIDEIFRVLKPGGTAWALMYYRNSSHWRYNIFFLKGILGLQRLKYDTQSLANRFTDGVYTGGNCLTKFYDKKQLRTMWSKFDGLKINIYDQRETIENLPHRYFPIGKLLPNFIKDYLITKIGLDVWIEAKK